MEINVKKLLESDILSHCIEFDDWPQTHTNPETKIEPYNHSLFTLRSSTSYDAVFGEQFPYEDLSYELQQNPKTKIHKIKYTVYLLTDMDDEDFQLMNILGETNDLEIFRTQVIKSLIEFKWTKYAGKVHYVTAGVHMIYVCLFFLHVNQAYIQTRLHPVDEEEAGTTSPIGSYYLFPMVLCHVVAMAYDTRQLIK